MFNILVIMVILIIYVILVIFLNFVYVLPRQILLGKLDCIISWNKIKKILPVKDIFYSRTMFNILIILIILVIFVNFVIFPFFSFWSFWSFFFKYIFLFFQWQDSAWSANLSTKIRQKAIKILTLQCHIFWNNVSFMSL